MPFDGSNFKRLVKQITTGDYYEPKQPACKDFFLFFDITFARSKLFSVNNTATKYIGFKTKHNNSHKSYKSTAVLHCPETC
jgi:hypothetical protein